MKQTKNISTKPAPPSLKKESPELFGRENYKWMLIGLVIMAIGFLLMAGGESSNPNVFDEHVIYSFRRITLAPIVIVAGLVVEVFAIMKKQNA